MPTPRPWLRTRLLPNSEKPIGVLEYGFFRGSPSRSCAGCSFTVHEDYPDRRNCFVAAGTVLMQQSSEEVVGTTVAMSFADYKTTSIAMTYFSCCLGEQRLEIQGALQSEIADALRGTPPTYEIAMNLKYSERVGRKSEGAALEQASDLCSEPTLPDFSEKPPPRNNWMMKIRRRKHS